MPSTYSNLKIQLMATGENTGTWGNVTNENLGTALEQAIVETATVTFASANVTLTLTDSNARQNARALRLNLTGTTGGARDLIVPAIQKPYLVNNGTADTITVKVSGQTGVAVPASTSMLLYNNGTDVVVAFNRVVGNLVGTASNATVLQTARNIQISGGVTAANVSFNGSAAVNLSVTGLNVSTADAGTLAVARGGTGATTLNSEAVVIGNATGAVKFVAPGTSGNVLTSNGTAWASQAIATGGNYVAQFYTSPATWTKPAGLKAVKVTVIGGGGSAASGTAGPDNPASTNSGGGGGGSIEYISAPSIPGPVTVTVGSGGAAVSAPGVAGGVANGNTGGTSSFGPFLSATGGSGGTTNYLALGGAGGTGSGGNINIPGGQQPIVAPTVPIAGPTGGGCFLNPFGGGRTPAVSTNGSAGGFGCGGSGIFRPNSSPGSSTGGAGGAGTVIVEEFY